ncbi:hypothetical protein [Gryllotalpicola sp.]|uniref:hypothetical protein n=1 Tax=Gryllotalpicola sp. TaxID=1932787 RepID=UPI00262FD7B1|nr:hypothetical protein [Gryllotalpicola sp.]
MSGSGGARPPRRGGKPSGSGAGRGGSGSGSDRGGSGAGRGGAGSGRSGGAGRSRATGRPRRDGDAPAWKRDGDTPAWQKKDDERPKRNGDRPAWKKDGAAPKRDGERPRREGDKPAWKRDGTPGERSARPRRDDGKPGLWTRDGKPSRGNGRGRDERPVRPPLTEEERLARELRPVRSRHDDPEIPNDVTAKQLDPGARGELRTLAKDNAEEVAKHLVMASRLIEDDPELAHRHALSAARRGGRIAVVRETLAITAYATGDFALALRELRTYRRISGRDDQIALMVDSERGVGRPERALELGRSVDRTTLSPDVQASLAIAMSGARLDLGQTELALTELEIPQLDPDVAYAYSPELFRAYGDVLEDLGRAAEAAQWHERADAAADALAEHAHVDESETVDVIEEFDEDPDDLAPDDAPDPAVGTDTDDDAATEG